MTKKNYGEELWRIGHESRGRWVDVEVLFQTAVDPEPTGTVLPPFFGDKCQRGHEWRVETSNWVQPYPGKPGYWKCRLCRREDLDRDNARRREKRRLKRLEVSL